MIRLVQLQQGALRRVALVEEPRLRLVEGVASVVQLAEEAVQANTPLTALIQQRAAGRQLDYDAVYTGASEWRLLPPIDHPHEPARCLVWAPG